jgi:carnitine-CoA ligase
MTADRQPDWVRDRIVGLVGKVDTSIPEAFRIRAELSEGDQFLWSGGRSWTYQDALAEVGRVAGFINGLRPGGSAGRVASYLDNRPEAMWSWFGTLAAGRTYVPLNRHHRGTLLKEMLERSGAVMLITDRTGLEEVGRLPERIEAVLLVDEDVPQTAGRQAVHPWSYIADVKPAGLASPRPEEIAIVMFTSGTTGRSKAVCLSHNQCVCGGAAVAWALRITPRDVFHCWWPLYHVAAEVDTTLPMVLAGGSVALYPRFSVSGFWGQVEESRATLFGGMANMLERLWSAPPSDRDADNSLRGAVIGYIPPRMRDRFERRFGVRLFDTYGMTEIEPIALPDPDRVPPDGSCGPPRQDLEVAVLDEDDGPLPPGQEGEIGVRAREPHVMFEGYEGDPEATADAWRGGWFHTGDLGRLDREGNLYFVDRLKDVIRRGGENISTWELERLVSEHEAVEQVAAAGVRGSGQDDEVKLVICATEDARIDPAELRGWCEGRMARFMLPRFIEVRAELPRTPTGKVLKSALQEAEGEVWDAEQASAAAGTAVTVNSSRQ